MMATLMTGEWSVMRHFRPKTALPATKHASGIDYFHNMKILEITPHSNWKLTVVSGDGRIGEFDAAPYLQYEAFEPLRTVSEFMKVSNGGYFVEWDCGADLSADSIEANWKVTGNVTQ